MSSTRREFLKAAAIGSAAVRYAPEVWLRAQGAADPWQEMPKILARIKAPVFPSRTFNVTKFGAVGDNKKDNTNAIRDAIAACAKAGGGRVEVPAGEFITGAIELKSRVNLHLDAKATIRFTRDQTKYPMVFTRWEGMEL